MAYSTTYLYPEDLNGTNPQNLISNEPHTLQAPGPTDYYFIIPKAAPFFVDSLVVVNAANNQPYVEGDDYQVGHLFIEAMDSIGRPIAGSIRFMKPTIVGQVKLTYRTIGGDWGFSDQAILRELSNKHLNPLIRSWGDIDVLPYSFPVLAHDQSIDSLVGSEQINATLITIAEILEATAEGTSKSHIDARNNPHVVTKAQVNLGLVPNFAMATDAQHTDATRNDLFTNPRGVLLLVNKFAVNPLNAHIQATGNVHDMVPADIGLGNVPNWSPATPQEAIDPTNNAAFMTPYTVSLLIQKLQNDPRLDQLIIDFNAHLTAQNPHHITPDMIGTYTSQQIDAMIEGVSQGGDAVTFDGQTADEWEAKFPAVADINEILQQLFEAYLAAITTLGELDVTDPIDPDEIARREATKLAWVGSGNNAYAIYNAGGDARIIADTSIKSGFPDLPLAEAVGKWSTAANAGYYIHPDGSVSSWGTGAITIPVQYRQGTMTAGNECAAVYASKDYIYLYLQTDVVRLITRAGSDSQIATQADIATILTNNGSLDPRVITVAEVGAPGTDPTWTPYGDANWVTLFNGIKSTASAQTRDIVDVRIGSEYLLVLTALADDTALWVYKFNYGASITLSNVTGTTMLTKHDSGTVVATTAVTDISHIDGSYGHFVMSAPIGPDSELFDMYSFGDTSQGQLEITSQSGPFLNISAGDGFTVTIDKDHYAEFWGDSPDNSLLWHGGSYIDITAPGGRT